MPLQERASSDADVREHHQALEQLEATPYFKSFAPRSYPLFAARHYKPQQYLEQVGIEKIGELVQHGFSLGQIAAMLDVSSRVMRRWIQGNKGYQEEISAARVFASDEMVHENLRLAREMPDLERAKLIISTQQWTSERWSKDIYGTKQVKLDGAFSNVGVSFQINLKAPGEAKAAVKQVLEGTFHEVEQLPAPQAPEISAVVEALLPSLDFSDEAEQS